jgi:hypothetical protein
MTRVTFQQKPIAVGDLPASAQGLAPTAVKTGTYAASAGDLVPFDLSGGSAVLNLPSAPADGTRIAFKIIAVDAPHANTLTINRGGTDVFNKAGGSTSLVVSALFEGGQLQYKASSGIWYVAALETPVGVANGAAGLDSTAHVPAAQLQFPPGLAFYDLVGHSIPGGGGVTNGDWNGYVDKLMFLLGSPRRKRNLALSGAVSAWQSNQNKTGDGGWGHVVQYLLPPGIGAGAGTYLPQADLCVMHHALNDLASLGQANPTPMQEAHRTILGRMVAAALAQVTDAAWGFTGTWTAGNTTGFNSPAGYKKTSTVNDTATLSIPADYPGGRTIGINLLVNPAHDLTVGVTIDGVAQPDVRLQGSVLCDPNGYNASGTAQWNMKCLRYAIAAAGAHTIILTLKTQTIGGSTLYVDSGHIESDPADGPIVLVPNPHRCVNYTLWGAQWANGASMSDAAVLAWQTALSTVVAEFPHAMGVDIDTALNKTAALFSSDGAHPNDAGHGVIAKTAYDALLGSGKVLSRQFSRVSPSLGQFWMPVGASINGYPQFTGNWTNKGGGAAPVSYRKDAYGQVHLQGAATGGATPTSPIFTLPAGYRPANNRIFMTGAQGGGTTMIQVSSNGVVTALAGGSTSGEWLDGINFVAEQ